MSPCTPADYINISYWSCLLVSVLTGNELFNQLAHFELYTAGGLCCLCSAGAECCWHS